MNLVIRNATLYLSIIVLALGVSVTQVAGVDKGARILVGQNASAMEQYAARELQRYLYQVSGSLLPVETARPESKPSGQVFVLGTSRSNPLVARLAEEGQVQISS